MIKNIEIKEAPEQLQNEVNKYLENLNQYNCQPQILITKYVTRENSETYTTYIEALNFFHIVSLLRQSGIEDYITQNSISLGDIDTLLKHSSILRDISSRTLKDTI